MKIGLIVFPGVTQLDLTGPHEVFARIPGAEVLIVGPTLEPVRSETGLQLVPDVTRETCPPLAILCVPGGPGVGAVMEDEVWLDFLRAQKPEKLTSVCTGSLILAAAGLLRGYRATSHWNALHLLEPFGAIPVEARVVTDRDRVTAAGVTAGLDLALELAGEHADLIRLQIEYGSSPETARPHDVEKMRAAPLRKAREELVRRLTNSSR